MKIYKNDPYGEKNLLVYSDDSKDISKEGLLFMQKDLKETCEKYNGIIKKIKEIEYIYEDICKRTNYSTNKDLYFKNKRFTELGEEFKKLFGFDEFYFGQYELGYYPIPGGDWQPFNFLIEEFWTVHNLRHLYRVEAYSETNDEEYTCDGPLGSLAMKIYSYAPEEDRHELFQLVNIMSKYAQDMIIENTIRQ